MSRKKMSRHQKNLHRAATRLAERQIVSDIDAIVENAARVDKREQLQPESAAAIRAMTLARMEAIATGIAWSDHFGFSEREVRASAELIIDWSILTDTFHMFGIDKPIGAMTVDELIEIMRHSRDIGQIPKPHA